MAGTHSIATYGRHLPAQTWLERVDHAIAAVFKILVLWQKRARERRELSEMSWRLMNDAGMTAEQVNSEIRKPFWKA